MKTAGSPSRRIPTICFAPESVSRVSRTLPIDALEVFNAATTLRRYNRYAFKYAQVRGLPMTAASDAHHHAAVGTAYTILNTEDFSVRGILAQIVKSNELNQEYLTPKDSMRKTWNNWMRLRRRKTLPTRPRASVDGALERWEAARWARPKRERALQSAHRQNRRTKATYNIAPNESAACAVPRPK